MYVTVGRIGRYRRQHDHFSLYRFGVKLYKVHVTRKGVAVYRYAGFVVESVTLDRFIRCKAMKRAQDYAVEKGFSYRFPIKHNQPLPLLEALATAVFDSDNDNNNTKE